MSHVVSVSTRVHDPAAVIAACQRLGLPRPVDGAAALFSERVTGLLVQLPEWSYPIVIDIASGLVRYDNYEGQWGDSRHLGLFLQAYSAEKTKLEARKQGLLVREQLLDDGRIKLQLLAT